MTSTLPNLTGIDLQSAASQVPGAAGPEGTDSAASKCPYLNGDMVDLTQLGATAEQAAKAAHADENFDALGLDFQYDPYGHAEWAFQNAPVFYSEKLGYWVVTRYEDVIDIFRDTENYSASNVLEKIVPLPDEAQEVLDSYGYGLSDTIVNTDEPIHTPRRRALQYSFELDQLAKLEPVVRKTVDSYIDKFIDSGEVDIFNELLYISPLTVALQFMGIPENDMDLIHDFSVAHATTTWGNPGREMQIDTAETNGKFWQHSQKILAKLMSPEHADDEGWIPHSIRAHREDPEAVPLYYLKSATMSTVTAAHETTALSSTNMLKYLLTERPDLWNQLREHPELLPNAIEESIRMQGGTHAWRRKTVNEVEIHGVRIPAGERVLLVTATANRDPEVFPDPHTFDLYRENVTKHLTFGYGIHQCMGRNLARLQMQVMFQQLLKRLPHLHLVADQRFGNLPSISFRGPQQLKVRWDATKNPENFGPISDENPPIVFNGPNRQLRTRSMVVTETSDMTGNIRRIVLTNLDDSPLPKSFSGAHIEINAGGLNRQYSLVNENDDAWEIAVQLEKDSRGGSKWIHENLRPGSVVEVRGPRNNFRFATDARKLILVGAGVGITPMLAMADEAKAQGIPYELHFSGSSKEKMAYLERIVRDHDGATRFYVTDEGTRMDVTQFADRYAEGTQLMTCGPDRFTEALLEATADWPEDTVRRESFTATTLLDPEKNSPFTVVKNSTGEEIEVPANMTLLETLEATGEDLYAECREGICGTCEVDIISGEAEHTDLVLSEKEKKANQRIMPCVSRGVCGKKLVLDI